MADIFYHFKKGFKAYIKNLMPYYFAVFTIALGFLTMIFAGALLVVFNSDSIFYSEEFLNNSPNADSLELLLMFATPANVLIMFIFSFLAVVVSVYLLSGLYGVCLEGVTGKASIKTFFASVFRRGGSYLLSSIVLFMLFGVFLFVLTLPILLVGPNLMLAFSSYLTYTFLLMVTGFLVLPFFFLVPVAVVSGQGVQDSFRQGFDIARKNYFELLVMQSLIFTLFLACFIVSIQLGFLAGFIIGFFLLVPLCIFTKSSYYLDKSVLKKYELPQIESSFPVDIVVSKPRTAEVRKPEQGKPRREKKKPSRAAAKAEESTVSIMGGGAKKRRSGIYMVASSTPITISGKPYKERKRKEAPRKKIPVKKAPAARRPVKAKRRR